MAKKTGTRPGKLSVYLYIPNIIGGHFIFFQVLCFC
jgi:hypothetical protein